MYCTYSVQDLDTKKIIGLYVARKDMVSIHGMSNKTYLIIILSSGALQWRNGAIFCQNYFTSINP